MRDKKSILMTGATGFLGSHLLRELLKQHYEVAILKRSFSNIDRIKDLIGSIKSFDLDKEPIEGVFKSVKAEVILHCATDYGRSEPDFVKVIDANLMFPLKLLKMGARNNVKYFINTDTILDQNINPYALSKSQFRQWLKMYSQGLICVNVALEHFYGPFDDKTKFISFVIDKLLANASKIDLTEGRQRRDFIYIDDAIDAFIKVFDQLNKMTPGFHRFEIGTDESIQIKELVGHIQSISGNTDTILNFGSIPYRDNEIMDTKTDTKAIRDLGWKPRYSLIEGLTKTINQEKKEIASSLKSALRNDT